MDSEKVHQAASHLAECILCLRKIGSATAILTADVLQPYVKRIEDIPKFVVYTHWNRPKGERVPDEIQAQKIKMMGEK